MYLASEECPQIIKLDAADLDYISNMLGLTSGVRGYSRIGSLSFGIQANLLFMKLIVCDTFTA